MKKRFIQILITSIVMSIFVLTPVYANPESLESQKQAVESQAASVNQQLVDLIIQFNALQQDIGNQQLRIAKSESQIEEAAKKEQEQYQDMKLRIQYMYEAGDTSFIEVLAEAKSYSELANKSEYVQKVHEYDRKKLKEYIETKNKVAALKLELESGQAEMQAMSEHLEGQKVSFEETLNGMRAQISDFDSQLAEAKTQAQTQLGELTEETEGVAVVGGQGGTTPPGGQGSSNPPANQPSAPSTPNAPSAPAKPSPPSKPSGGNSSNASLGQQIASTACNYVGNPYVYGGTSLTNGADCSGFVMSVHRLFGISTPRDSWGQLAGGRAVNYSDILPGDVIVYSNHVAIYIGGGSIVHASNSAPYPAGGIKISSPWNYRTVLGVRRYW